MNDIEARYKARRDYERAAADPMYSQLKAQGMDGAFVLTGRPEFSEIRKEEGIGADGKPEVSFRGVVLDDDGNIASEEILGSSPLEGEPTPGSETMFQAPKVDGTFEERGAVPLWERDSFLGTIHNYYSTRFGELKDAAVGISQGINQGVENLSTMIGGDHLVEWLDENVADLTFEHAAPETTEGKILSGLSEFGTQLAAGGGAMKMLGVAGKWLTGFGAGAFADFATNPDDPTLGEFAASIGTLDNETAEAIRTTVAEHLSRDADDSELEVRLKNLGVGAGLGIAFDGIMNSYRAMRVVKETAPDAFKAFTDKYGMKLSAEGDAGAIPMTPATHAFPEQEANRANMVNLLHRQEVPQSAPDGSRWTKAKAAQYWQDLAEESGTRVTTFDDASRDRVAQVMADEAIAALAKDGNASDWYGADILKMNDTLRQIHPELEPGSVNDGVFKLILALSSNGKTVDFNLRATEKIYQAWKDGGSLPNDMETLEALAGGFGKEAAIILQSMEKANVLADGMGGWDKMIEFLNKPMTVKELKQLGFNVSREGVGHQTYGSVIFGPKIGGGFYQNLIGNLEPVTFDRWWTASWGRWTGNALEETSPETYAKHLDRFRAAAGKQYRSKAAALEAATKIYREHVANNFQPRDELNRAAQRLVEGQTPRMREDPGGAAARDFMRATVARSLEILNEQGYVLSAADLQATLWFPEKELFSAMGIGNARSAPDSYSRAAQRLLDEIAGGRNE